MVGSLFAGSVVAIVLAAEPFAESLIETGERFNIDRFLLVQLVAPLASEAPELLVAGLFAWRLNTNAGFGALVSSKVNQWTLARRLAADRVRDLVAARCTACPIDEVQRDELFVTAAQSAFAVAVLANRRISVEGGVALSGCGLRSSSRSSRA